MLKHHAILHLQKRSIRNSALVAAQVQLIQTLAFIADLRAFDN